MDEGGVELWIGSEHYDTFPKYKQTCLAPLVCVLDCQLYIFFYIIILLIRYTILEDFFSVFELQAGEIYLFSGITFQCIFSNKIPVLLCLASPKVII